MTKNAIVLLALLAASGLMMTGCEPDESAASVTPKLCGGCGQIKGSDVCCKADAEKCTKCGLAKGSPGCCKIN